MPPDMRSLLRGLEDYQRELERHRLTVSECFDAVSRAWSALDGVFQGNAADEFRPVWQRSMEGFGVYVEETGVIARLLSERVEALGRAERGER